MNVATSRDFKIGGRTYRDTQIARDVHQISNPATGHVYGEVVQIPADGRVKAYYLAGPGRERAETWEAAVQAARAQCPDVTPLPSPSPAALFTSHTVTTTAQPAPVAAPEPPKSDTTGWLTTKEAVRAYGISRVTLYKRINAGAIQAVMHQGGGGAPQWRISPPATPVPAKPDAIVLPPPPSPAVPEPSATKSIAALPPTAEIPAGWLFGLRAAKRAYGMSEDRIKQLIEEGTIPAFRSTIHQNRHGAAWVIAPPSNNAGAVLSRAAAGVPIPQRIAAAETAAPEPTVIVRPAATKVRELETQLADLQTRLDAMEAASKRRSWLTRLFGAA